MKAEMANPFILAAVNTFMKEMKVSLSRNEIKLKDSPMPSKDVSIVIGITGAARGQVVYSMDGNMALAISRAMLPGLADEEVKKLVNSAVSELANIITGQASIILAGDNLTIDITPPAVFVGKGISMDFLNLKTICLTFQSEIGGLELNIALSEEEK